MDKISEVKITDCKESIYIKPARIHYKQDGRSKSWDVMKIHDSVSIVIFNVTREVLVFVKQFRPAVYFAHVELEDNSDQIDVKNNPVNVGITLELCAGIVDKEDQTIAETARDEVLEECGYDVPLPRLHKVTSFRSGVGISGSLQTLYYAEVTDSMRVSKGGGIYAEGEFIDVVEMSVPEARGLILDETVARPASMLFALMWFFEKRNTGKLLQKL